MTDKELTRRFDALETRIKARIKEEILDVKKEVEETRVQIRREGVATRRHFDVVAEHMKTEISLIAEGHRATTENVAALSIRGNVVEQGQGAVEIRQLAIESRQKRLEEKS